MLNWIFVVDTLNFSFYGDKNAELFACEYRGKRYTGYWSLCACINRALDEGIAITDPLFYCTVSWEQFAHVFRSASSAAAPMLRERHRVLQEAGCVLRDHFGGSVERLVVSADKDCVTFLNVLCRHFPSYRDYREVDGGETVFFLKRAQILIADIWAAFLGRYFDSVDALTMFADYRVPQILCSMGVLWYSDALMKDLRDEVDPINERYEIEIRACSIHAVERMREYLKDDKFNAVTIDFYLWDRAKELGQKLAHIPIHKKRTIYY